LIQQLKPQTMNTTLHTLEIWKLDTNREFTMDDPYFSEPFGIEGSEEETQDANRIQAEAIRLINRYAPVIDCAGYRAVVLDNKRNEIMVKEKMY
jgi:hypothetical protein